METKSCAYCGTALKGRSDKKFCDDQCRTSFNNKLKTEPSAVKQINTILRKNRRILEELLTSSSDQAMVVLRKKLIEKGFNPDYHTHVYKTQVGKAYDFCYDYGIQYLDKDMVMIVKKFAEA